MSEHLVLWFLALGFWAISILHEILTKLESSRVGLVVNYVLMVFFGLAAVATAIVGALRP